MQLGLQCVQQAEAYGTVGNAEAGPGHHRRDHQQHVVVRAFLLQRERFRQGLGLLDQDLVGAGVVLVQDFERGLDGGVLPAVHELFQQRAQFPSQ